MTMHLALYTFGVFERAADDPVNDGFHARNDPIFASVDRAPGFIARSGYDDELGPPSWGVQVFPRFYEERGDGWSPSTLSLWRDLESPFAFSYYGLHAEALSHGREWFRTPQWPPYALWWVQAGTTPTWAQAVAKHAALHADGPGPDVFSFRRAYDAAGKPTRLDRARVADLAARIRGSDLKPVGA